MTKSTSQVEKNVAASFGYVKKDMMMLNDAFSDLHEKIQHLSLNHAGLLEELGRIRNEIAKISGKKKNVSSKKAKSSNKKGKNVVSKKVTTVKTVVETKGKVGKEAKKA